MVELINFSGRMSRTSFWITYMVTCLISMISLCVGGLAVLYAESLVAAIGFIMVFATLVAYVIILFASLVKRCRDSGIHPLFSLLSLVPYVSIIAIIVIGCLPTDLGIADDK